NTDLGTSLSNLASNAWESGQNRALNSAQPAGVYGQHQPQQQVNNLATGAGLQNTAANNLFNFGTQQQQAPWLGIQNATNVMGSLPGNTSKTQPLFNNPWASAIGGASLGSQIGG